jgi:plasmid stability protein
MPTLYVENVPRDLYEALRKRAKSQRRSIAAEVLALLERNFPTQKELKRRHSAFVRRVPYLRRNDS